MFDAFNVGEKRTTAIPSKIDVDFFYSVGQNLPLLIEKKQFFEQKRQQVEMSLRTFLGNMSKVYVLNEIWPKRPSIQIYR